jgi:hypothetical protein
MRMWCACLLFGARMRLVSPTLGSLTHAWVFVLRGVHAHARVVCVPDFGSPTLVSLTHAWVFVPRGVHTRAHVLRVPAFG